METTRMADRISERMEALNLETAQVAKACGVTRAAARNWRSGEVQPRAETLEALSQVLKCDVRWLLGIVDRVGRP